ncbi:MAG: DUF2254 domain-containing protein, partial [Balneolaceae bacterium]
IAGSMITVTSVVFSITIVVLTLASGQFGSRMLRNFMRDTGNQMVLGVFIATFIYSLLILRRIRNTGDFEFIPYLSVTVGVLLAFISVGVLIYFIHHVASKIQAESIINFVYKELTLAIDRLFPEQIGIFSGNEENPESALPEKFAREAQSVRAGESNYLQAVEDNRIMELAGRHNLIIRLLNRPGDFVIKGGVLMEVWSPSPVQIDDNLKLKLSETMILGLHRTITQDAEHGIHQLVEIAVRALSPGINDPYTAINCIDRLAAGLSQLVHKQFPASCRYDENNKLRVVVSTTSFGGYLDAAFNQIRQNADSNPAVLIRMLEVISSIAKQASTEDQYSVLREHALMIKNAGIHSINEKRDRDDLCERFMATEKLLNDRLVMK